jgi:uncharacterized protein YcnI
MKKIFLALLVFVSSISFVSAHIVVKPNTVGVGAFQTFTVGVPVEKDIPTIGIRLLIPEGLKYVSPNVKPGWRINVVKEGEGEGTKVTEITWSGGTIPVGQRDDFVFSAQVPSIVTSLNWKAYQTYSDGSVVSWDQDPSTITPGEESNPYSVTIIENDLKSNKTEKENNTIEYVSLLFSLIALATVIYPKIKRL